MARTLSPDAFRDYRHLGKLRHLVRKVWEVAVKIDPANVDEIYAGMEDESVSHVIRAIQHAMASAEYVIGAIDHDWVHLQDLTITKPDSSPTTPDSNRVKVNRVKTALADPRNEGKSNRQLAKMLGVDEATIRKYRKLVVV